MKIYILILISFFVTLEQLSAQVGLTFIGESYYYKINPNYHVLLFRRKCNYFLDSFKKNNSSWGARDYIVDIELHYQSKTSDGKCLFKPSKELVMVRVFFDYRHRPVPHTSFYFKKEKDEEPDRPYFVLSGEDLDKICVQLRYHKLLRKRVFVSSVIKIEDLADDSFIFLFSYLHTINLKNNAK